MTERRHTSNFFNQRVTNSSAGDVVGLDKCKRCVIAPNHVAMSPMKDDDATPSTALLLARAYLAHSALRPE